MTIQRPIRRNPCGDFGRLVLCLCLSLSVFIAAVTSLTAGPRPGAHSGQAVWSGVWPILKVYDRDHIEKIVLPLGGIGTGTVGLGGRGNLCDWEIMNRPAKGFTPWAEQQAGPFFAIFVSPQGGRPVSRALEGPLPLWTYESSQGGTAVNHGLPRFHDAVFAAAYPLGQIYFSDPGVPVEVRLEAFNPLVPGDAEASGIPVAVLRYVILNKTTYPVHAAVCGTLPNFIGMDGANVGQDWKNEAQVRGAKKNKNEFRSSAGLRGLFMTSSGVDPKDAAWGTIVLATTAPQGTNRTSWLAAGWGRPVLDFWDDFSADGRLEERAPSGADMPFGSLTGEVNVPAGGSAGVTFLLTWHFPNRRTWTPKNTPEDLIGNYYTTRWQDAWQAAEAFMPQMDALETKTVDFVRAFASSTLPPKSRTPPFRT